jgi:hypothetical protein
MLASSAPSALFGTDLFLALIESIVVLLLFLWRFFLLYFRVPDLDIASAEFEVAHARADDAAHGEQNSPGGNAHYQS